MKSNLDLINACDSYPLSDGEGNQQAHASSFEKPYTLLYESGDSVLPIGLMLESVVNELAKVPVRSKGEMEVNRAKRTVSAFRFDTEESRTKAVAATLQYWREKGTFDVLKGWRGELYPVYGGDEEVLFSVERSGAHLFGIVCYGIHLTAFVRSPTSSRGMKIWVPRRAATKQTYPSMLDSTVAGGLATGGDPFDCLIRECQEEAGLAEELIREKASFTEMLTYIHIRDDHAGGEEELLQPECEYVYEIEVPSEVVLSPNDSEVQHFNLWTVEEVQQHLAGGYFNPNCAETMLAFFIRHGSLTPENEKDFGKIKKRLHR